jgi:site-specific DNA-cytosine methylase
VCDFAEVHRYNAIIVENVVDARDWVMWPAWLHAMELLGYNHKCVYLNSMFAHPTPQSRDRMYVVFWRKGNGAYSIEDAEIIAKAIKVFVKPGAEAPTEPVAETTSETQG